MCERCITCRIDPDDPAYWQPMAEAWLEAIEAQRVHDLLADQAIDRDLEVDHELEQLEAADV